MQKTYLSANDLVYDSFLLARKIYDTGFVPDSLVVLWRGGTPVGIVLHEFFEQKGISTYHTVLKAVSYTGIGERGEPEIENFDSFLSRVREGERILVVDDIFDTGKTVEAVERQVVLRGAEVRFATLYWKVGASLTARTEPDFHLKQTDRWLVFPHELQGLTPEELRAKDPRLPALLGE